MSKSDSPANSAKGAPPLKPPTTFRQANAWFGIVLLLIGVGVLFKSLQLQFFTGHIPGPGFMPTVLSVLLIIASAWLIVERFLPVEETDTNFVLPTRKELVRPLGLWAATVAAALLLAPLGFLLTTFLFLVAVGFLVERRYGITELILPVALPLVVWVVFKVLLSVPLPQGVLPF